MTADGLTVRERVWRERMERQRRSRLTVRGFGRLAGVSTAAFFQWRKRLAQPGSAARSAAAKAWFVPVTVRDQRGDGIRCEGIRVELPNAATIHLSEHIDAERLVAVVQAAGRVGVARTEARGWFGDLVQAVGSGHVSVTDGRR